VCIGRCSTTLDLAALGPNLVIFNFVSFGFAFLAITTTIRASRALAAGDKREAGRAISTSAIIAFTAGSLIGAMIFFFSGAALASTGAIPEILATAEGYCRVRALAIPAVLVTMVLQAGTFPEHRPSFPPSSFSLLLLLLLYYSSNKTANVKELSNSSTATFEAAFAGGGTYCKECIC
jgi:MATE family multidrug resistance protein